MKKRILAFGLCAAMAAGTMAGCSSGADGQGADTTAAQAEAGDTASAQQQGAASDAPAPAASEDLEGSLVFAIWDRWTT